MIKTNIGVLRQLPPIPAGLPEPNAKKEYREELLWVREKPA